MDRGGARIIARHHSLEQLHNGDVTSSRSNPVLLHPAGLLPLCHCLQPSGRLIDRLTPKLAAPSPCQTTMAPGPKSILKNKNTSSITEDDHRRARNLEIALHHANLIQAQKDAEARILSSIEALLDLPKTSSALASSPSSTDTQDFLAAIVCFQPKDFDDLIEERHAAGICGYALCPNPPRSAAGNKGRFTIHGSGKDGKVVERKKVEMWCSDLCARRAMYARVQLDQTPSWLRQEDPRPQDMRLMPEDEASTSGKRSTSANAHEDEDRDTLARERGEDATSAKSKGLIKDEIVEKTPTLPVLAPVLGEESGHNTIEGYEPGSTQSRDTFEDLLP